jgi:hypothetical protein
MPGPYVVLRYANGTVTDGVAHITYRRDPHQVVCGKFFVADADDFTAPMATCLMCIAMDVRRA